MKGQAETLARQNKEKRDAKDQIAGRGVAEEDRKRKEEIETRNHADQAAYGAERMLKESGDKVSAADKQAIESAIENLRKAIEQNDAAEMKRTMDALNAAQHKAAEAMYKNAGAGAAQPGGGAGEGPGAGPAGAAAGRGDGDVIDAEVVEEEKK